MYWYSSIRPDSANWVNMEPLPNQVRSDDTDSFNFRISPIISSLIIRVLAHVAVLSVLENTIFSAASMALGINREFSNAVLEVQNATINS